MPTTPVFNWESGYWPLILSLMCILVKVSQPDSVGITDHSLPVRQTRKRGSAPPNTFWFYASPVFPWRYCHLLAQVHSAECRWSGRVGADNWTLSRWHNSWLLLSDSFPRIGYMHRLVSLSVRWYRWTRTPDDLCIFCAGLPSLLFLRDKVRRSLPRSQRTRLCPDDS